jgi:hypothetical protein
VEKFERVPEAENAEIELADLENEHGEFAEGTDYPSDPSEEESDEGRHREKEILKWRRTSPFVGPSECVEEKEEEEEYGGEEEGA